MPRKIDNRPRKTETRVLRGRSSAFIQDYFERRIVVHVDSCWIWVGCVAGSYPAFKYYIGNQLVEIKAHRAAMWIYGKGPVPKALDVCHRCDVPLCVNPRHLFIGTVSDNMRDAIAKGRRVYPPSHLHSARKLTTEQVLEIRSTYVGAPGQVRDMAAEYGVSNVLIGKVVRGEIWKNGMYWPSGTQKETGK